MTKPNTAGLCARRAAEDLSDEPASEMGAAVKDRIDEVKEPAEAGKTQIVRDLIMKRYSETKEDTEKWFANFESDLESYVQRRVELSLLEKGRS